MDRRTIFLIGAAGSAALALAACRRNGQRNALRDAGASSGAASAKASEAPAAKPKSRPKRKPEKPPKPTGRASAVSASVDFKSLPKEQRAGVLTAARAEKAAEELRTKGRCETCALVAENCICNGLVELRRELEAAGDVCVSFAVWMHVSERVRASNTGKLMQQVLPDCEVFLHGVPADVERFQARIASRNTYVLFPSDDAVPLSAVLGDLKEPRRDAAKASSSKPLMVLVDGTWDQAKRMHKTLKDLPRVALDTCGGAGASAFTWRHQSEEGRVTTAEAAALVLDSLGGHGEAAAIGAGCLRRGLTLLDRALEFQTHYSKANPDA